MNFAYMMKQLIQQKNILFFDPNATWKQKTLTNFTARELQVPIFKNGECVYESPSIEEIKAYCQKEVETYGTK